MFRYFARLHDKFDLPVYPIVVFPFDSPRKQLLHQVNSYRNNFTPMTHQSSVPAAACGERSQDGRRCFHDQRDSE